MKTRAGSAPHGGGAAATNAADDARHAAEHHERSTALHARLLDYLRTHAPDRTRPPEFLLSRGNRTDWLVRWPNGSVKWESSASLQARQIATPRKPLVGAVD